MMPEPDERPARCAIYERQSLDAKGDGAAVDRQDEDNLAIVERRGWHVVAKFVDNDISASGKRKRPGFEQLIAEIEAGRVDVVLAWSLDRLTRNRHDTLRLIEACQPRGLMIALARGSDLDMSTPAGRLTADILASVARHEIEVKGDRQRRAALQRSKVGKPPLGVRLTGYTVTGEIVPEEAALVRALFERFSAGESLRGLATWLNATKAPSRHGGRWVASTLHDMLSNPRYAGRAVYQGAETGQPGKWQPLVNDDLFTFVQARLSDPRRKAHRHGTDRKHLGAGLYLCGQCEDKVTSWSGHRYRCAAGCICRSRDNIDSFVVDVIRERLSRPDLADLLPVAHSGAARAATDEVLAIRARLAQFENDYDAGHIDGRRYAVATEKAKADMSEALAAQARLTVVTGAATVFGEADPVAAFDGAPLMIRRNTIDALCVVRLLAAPRGRKEFRPESVDIRWR